MEQACKYTNNLLDKGSEQEILSLKKHVGNQLLNLINNTPKPDTDVTFQFVTDADKFKQAVKVREVLNERVKLNHFTFGLFVLQYLALERFSILIKFGKNVQYILLSKLNVLIHCHPIWGPGAFVLVKLRAIMNLFYLHRVHSAR